MAFRCHQSASTSTTRPDNHQAGIRSTSWCALHSVRGVSWLFLVFTLKWHLRLFQPEMWKVVPFWNCVLHRSVFGIRRWFGDAAWSNCIGIRYIDVTVTLPLSDHVTVNDSDGHLSVMPENVVRLSLHGYRGGVQIWTTSLWHDHHCCWRYLRIMSLGFIMSWRRYITSSAYQAAKRLAAHQWPTPGMLLSTMILKTDAAYPARRLEKPATSTSTMASSDYMSIWRYPPPLAMSAHEMKKCPHRI